MSLAAIEDAFKKHWVKKLSIIEEGPILAVCAKEEAGEKTKIFVFTRFSTSIEEVNRSLKEAGFSNLVKVYKVQQLAEIPLMGTGKIQLSCFRSSNSCFIESDHQNYVQS